MAYTNENELRQALMAVRDRLAIKDKTEAQALVLSSTYPNCVYYTSDTHCIVIGGNIYGRGEQITANVFAYLPASEQDPSDPAFNDSTKIYIQPTSTAGVMKLWWYYNGTWINSDSQAMSVPTSAEDISYDLTSTPDLGTGDVQSAIEALDGKVEAVDARIDDEKVEFIKERFPSETSIPNLYGRSNFNGATFSNTDDNTTWTITAQSNTNYRCFWTKELVPKGTHIIVKMVSTVNTNYWRILGYSTDVRPQDYYASHSNTIVGYKVEHKIGATNNKNATYTIEFTMPEDGWLVWTNIGDTDTGATQLHAQLYDPTLLVDLYTEYYKKGVADGAGMASIAGLGYNIFDYITGAVNMEGFEYGVELYRQYYPQFTGNIQNKFNGNTKIVYCPKFDFSVATASAGSLSVFRYATHLVVVPDLDYGSRSVSLAYSFDGCTNLVYVGDFKNCIISYVQQLFRNCSKLLHIGKMDWSSGGQYTFQGCTSLQRIEEINLEHLANSEGSFALTSQYNIFGVNSINSTLRYVVFKNFGMKSAHVGPYQFNYISNWGVATAAQPDALQSLILTWNDYLFDRAGANETAKQAAIDAGTYDESTWTDPYPVCTVRFSGTVKNLLNTTTVNEQTLTEIITSKGYTIV